jgi:hypothetical protein
VLHLVAAATQTHNAFANPLTYVLIAVVVGLIILLRIPRNRRNSRGPEPGEPLGPGNPGNLSAGMRAWRRRRAAAGKGDNWLTRPLIQVGTPRNGPPARFSPDDDKPSGPGDDR